MFYILTVFRAKVAAWQFLITLARPNEPNLFEYHAPVIDIDQAMNFILDLLQTKGAVFLLEIVYGDLWENEGRLLDVHQADAIVNSSDLGARELASDSTVHPARGGLLRLVNDGKDFEKVTRAMGVNKAEKIDFIKLKKQKKEKKAEKEDCDIVFIVHRNDDILVLATFIGLDE